MNANELYRLLEIDKDLVTGFSIFFSRFEYALKRTTRYAVGNKNDVKADWDRFARDYNSSFTPERTAKLKSSIVYLEARPPKKQIVRSGTLGWKDVRQQNTQRLQQILCAVRRVRNNLFHGGKFPDGPIEEPGRDTRLLQSCMIILEECLRLDYEVRRNFNSNER